LVLRVVNVLVFLLKVHWSDPYHSTIISFIVREHSYIPLRCSVYARRTIYRSIILTLILR
jgi:hypothetical protein